MSTSPITYVPTDVLKARLTHSVDLEPIDGCASGYGPCPHVHSERGWDALWTEKYEECSEDFIDAVCADFDTPVCVRVECNMEATWTMGNGHHRVAIALRNSIPYVPVVFSFDRDYMHTEFTENSDRPASYGEFDYWDDGE